jgi:hypothetical protein
MSETMGDELKAFLGFLFCFAGILIILRNHKITEYLVKTYSSKNAETNRKTSYILFYIRGLIIAIIAIVVGFYLLKIF